MADKKVKNLMQGIGKDPIRDLPKHSQHITKERIRELLPSKTRIAVTDELMELISRFEEDTGMDQYLLEEDFLGYMHVAVNSGNVSLVELANAIKYCNLKRHYSNRDAWAMVFPEKYKALVEANKPVDNFVGKYNSTKLVIGLEKEMMIPVHLQYAPYFHAAVKELYNVGVQGRGGKSSDGKEMTVTPMVKVQALKELAALTKQPEEQKLSISVDPGAKAVSMQEEMNAQLKELVSGQKRRLAEGEDIIDVQQIGINFDNVGTSDE